ncbi:MAG TPA: RidA family protein [Planctomycetota bacterium]|jgi:2-iminobutanoate/2-iminopropanoate deaminase|nr:RidA family protein [Planctomycetota bacterium]
MRTRLPLLRSAPWAALLAVLATACTAPFCVYPAPSHLPAEGALGPYSAAVSSGNLVFLSGKIGKTGGTIGQDVDAAIDSIEKDLGRVGLTLADVVSVNVFVTDIANYPELNAAYAKRFPQPFPARTTVAVTALPGGAKVEIQAVAARRRA